MKDLSRIKIVPVALFVLILAAVLYIVFNNRDMSEVEPDTTALVDMVTPVVKTLEVNDPKKEQIKGYAVELPENYFFTSIVNQQDYRGYKCESPDCLMYIVSGNNREFIISTSKISKASIERQLQDVSLNVQGSDNTFSASIYYGADDEGNEIKEDTRVEYYSGCIDELCYSSDQMYFVDKEANTKLVNEFIDFINSLKIN